VGQQKQATFQLYMPWDGQKHRVKDISKNVRFLFTKELMEVQISGIAVELVLDMSTFTLSSVIDEEQS